MNISSNYYPQYKSIDQESEPLKEPIPSCWHSSRGLIISVFAYLLFFLQLFWMKVSFEPCPYLKATDYFLAKVFATPCFTTLHVVCCTVRVSSYNCDSFFAWIFLPPHCIHAQKRTLISHQFVFLLCLWSDAAHILDRAAAHWQGFANL